MGPDIGGLIVVPEWKSSPFYSYLNNFKIMNCIIKK
jgi:hypothetical protein